MSGNNEFKFIHSGRIKLSSSQLQDVCDDIKEKSGLDVIQINEIDEGYEFVGKHNIPIGLIEYLPNENKYRRFNYYRGAKEEIQKKDRISRTSRTKKFKLQRGKRIGIAIGAAGLALLLSIGAIKTPTKAVEPDYIATNYSQQLNTVASANDIILTSWANYAMGLVHDGASGSNYEYAKTVSEDLRTNYFNDLMMNYYNYVDQVESGLPEEVIGKLRDSYRNKFRNKCYEFDEALENSFYNYATFDESPYADAIVFDQTRNRVVEKGQYGESYDSNGNLILIDSNVGYTVYIKAVDVPGNDYSITNLPSDAMFINGETYVSDEHLDDFTKGSELTK